MFISLDSLFQPIGTIVYRHLALGIDRHRILVVVVMELKRFAPTITFQDNNSQDIEVPIEVIEKQPRCYHGFSHSHRLRNCFLLVEDQKQNQRLCEDFDYRRGNGSSFRGVDENKRSSRYSLSEYQRHNRSPSPTRQLSIPWKEVSPRPSPTIPHLGSSLHINSPPPNSEVIAKISARRAANIFVLEDSINLAIFQATQLKPSVYL